MVRLPACNGLWAKATQDSAEERPGWLLGHARQLKAHIGVVLGPYLAVSGLVRQG